LRLQRTLLDGKKSAELYKKTAKLKRSKRDRLAFEKELIKSKLAVKKCELELRLKELRGAYSPANLASELVLDFIDRIDDKDLTDSERQTLRKYRKKRSMAFSRISNFFVNLFLVAEARLTAASDATIPPENEAGQSESVQEWSSTNDNNTTNDKQDTYIIGKDDV
jgi:hypothetical protein